MFLGKVVTRFEVPIFHILLQSRTDTYACLMLSKVGIITIFQNITDRGLLFPIVIFISSVIMASTVCSKALKNIIDNIYTCKLRNILASLFLYNESLKATCSPVIWLIKSWKREDVIFWSSSSSGVNMDTYELSFLQEKNINYLL